MKKHSILSIKKSPKKTVVGENAIHKYIVSDGVANSDDILIKLVRDAVLILDDNFRILHWNKGAEEMYGWTEEEVTGKISYEVFHTNLNKDTPTTIRNELTTNGFYRKEFIHNIKNGTQIYTHTSASAIINEEGLFTGIILIIKDITERKKREFDLVNHAALVDNIKDAVLSLDKDFCIKTWNKGAEKIYGWKENEAIGRFVYELLQTEWEPDLSLEKLKKTLESKGYYTGEIIHKTKSGETKYIQLSSSATFDSNGIHTGMVAICKDITEYKQKEDQLKYHAALMENIKDAVFSIDMQFEIKSWNKGAEETYGWTAEEAIGKLSYELLLTDYLSISQEEAIKTFKETGFFIGDVGQKTKSGKEIIVAMSASALYDQNGAMIGAVSLNKDITENKIKEAELIYHAALMENIKDAVFSTDEEYRIKSWNKGAEEIYGWTHNEAIGKIPHKLLHTNYLDHSFEWMVKNFTEKKYFTGEVAQITKTGKPIVVSMSAKAVINAEGQIEGVVMLNRDITESKANENKLKELTGHLEEQVTLKTKELQDVFERVTDGFAALDKAWHFTFINKTAGQLFGHPPENLIGKHIWSEFPEAVGLAFYQAYYKAMETQEPEHIQEYYQPFNRWFENHIYPSPEGVSVYFKDITERKQAEQNLEKASRLYKYISSINQMIVRTTDETTLFSEACKIAIDIGKFKMAWVGLVDPKTKLIKPVIYDGLDLDYLNSIKIIADPAFAEGKGPSGRAFEEGIAVFCNDIANDPKMIPWKEQALQRGFFSSIALPIRRLGKVIGTYTLYAATPDFFDEQEIALLEEVAGDISFALDFIEKEAMRKRTQDSLIKSERRYQSLTEVSPAGIFHANRDGLITYVNPRWSSIAGLSFADALGSGWHKSIFEEDKERLYNQWADIIKKGSSGQLEFRFQRSDNSIVWVIGQTLPEKNSANQVIGYVGTITDITELKHAEDKVLGILKEKETILNRINDSMVSLDTQWRYTFINETALARHPQTREEIIGKRFWDVNPGLKGTTFEKMYLKSMQTQTVGEIEDYYEPMKIWFNIKAYPAPDGMTVLFKDVTESRKVKEDLKKINDQLNLSQKIAKIGYWEIDLISNNNYWSDEMYHLCEVENDGTVITPEDFYKSIHPDEKESVIENLASIIANKKDFGISEYRFVYRDGSIRHMISTGQLIMDDQGKPILINGTMQDITERKNIQLEIVKEKYLSENIVDNLPGIFYMINRKGKFIRWNRNFEEVMGYSSDEVENMNRLDLAIDDEKELIAKSIRESLTSGRESVLTHFVTKNGTIIPFHLTGMAIDYNAERCLMVMGIDFSERAKIQEEMDQASHQLQALTDHLQTIREEERKRIGRELHDELGQQLTAMKMDIAWINKKTPDDSGLIKEKMKEVIELLDGSNTALRRILNELRPTILDQHGLLDALQWQARQFTSTTNVSLELISSEKEIKVKDEIATCVFRIFQESLTNISRYANAKKVVANIALKDSLISISIADDGNGFDIGSEQPKSRQPFGILGMKERVRALNGTFELISEIGKGTCINISLPL